MKNKKAFTLIELLVVIAIIGLLATIAIVALNNARSKARDARRVADVKQIQTALDLYYNDAGHYPLNNIFASGTIFTTSTVTGTTTYMQIVPHAPTPTDGSCNVAANTYSYAVDSEGKAYNIGYCLGGPAGSMAAGYKCATPDGVFNLACAGAATSTNMVGGSGSASFNSCGDQVSYGGQNYNTVQIGTQCWFTQNLNVGTMIAGGTNQADFSTSTSASSFQKYCYGDVSDSCTTDGALYQWHTAMALPAACDNHNSLSPCDITSPRQGICPTNWHVPSDADWHTLELNYDTETNCPAGRYIGACGNSFSAFINTTPGYLNALYSGAGAGTSYSGRGNFMYFWSSTQFDSANSIGRFLNNWPWANYANSVVRGSGLRTSAYSVRCLHD